MLEFIMKEVKELLFLFGIGFGNGQMSAIQRHFVGSLPIFIDVNEHGKTTYIYA